jgi:aerobic-type carbon monoxide dehydrogenase small subunit (CoxS/CutS family)
MPESVAFKLNDKPTRLEVDAERTLLWVLRTDLGLTGTKFGCGMGQCGSCTVLVNNMAVRSCLLKVKNIRDKEVVTIEGLAKNGKLHPLQKAYMEHDGFQCGYCTPGMIMSGVALLDKNQEMSSEEIVRGLERNLCRCGAHARIIQAMQTAASEMKGARKS